VVAFLKPAALHHVLELYAPATGTLVPTGQAAEGLVCNERIVAFRTSEAAQGLSLNGPPDGDQADDVLQTYDLSRPQRLATSHPADCVGNSHQAVRACPFEACDPRLPYRVKGDAVKFLTFECDQGGVVTTSCPGGGTDLNGDGDAGDLII